MTLSTDQTRCKYVTIEIGNETEIARYIHKYI